MMGLSHRQALRRAQTRKRAAVEAPGRDWLDRLHLSVSIIANLTVVGALVVAWNGYRAGLEQNRRIAAFEIVSDLNSEEMLLVQRRFTGQLQRLPLDELHGQVLPRDTMATMMSQLVSTSADADELRQDIIALVSYFDSVAICVEAGTCDEGIVHSQIGESAERYACLLLPYTKRLRDTYLMDGLGDGLARMISYEERC